MKAALSHHLVGFVTYVYTTPHKQLFVKTLLAAPSQLTMTEILQMLADNYICMPFQATRHTTNQVFQVLIPYHTKIT